MIFCLKIEEFLLFLTCCFKFTTNHESKFASTCKMCFPNTCKTVLCSGNQFPVKIHIFLFFNFVPLFMELPLCTIFDCIMWYFEKRQRLILTNANSYQVVCNQTEVFVLWMMFTYKCYCVMTVIENILINEDYYIYF